MECDSIFRENASRGAMARPATRQTAVRGLGTRQRDPLRTAYGSGVRAGSVCLRVAVLEGDATRFRMFLQRPSPTALACSAMDAMISAATKAACSETWGRPMSSPNVPRASGPAT